MVGNTVDSKSWDMDVDDLHWFSFFGSESEDANVPIFWLPLSAHRWRELDLLWVMQDVLEVCQVSARCMQELDSV